MALQPIADWVNAESIESYRIALALTRIMRNRFLPESASVFGTTRNRVGAGISVRKRARQATRSDPHAACQSQSQGAGGLRPFAGPSRTGMDIGTWMSSRSNLDDFDLSRQRYGRRATALVVGGMNGRASSCCRPASRQAASSNQPKAEESCTYCLEALLPAEFRKFRWTWVSAASSKQSEMY
jgi:hypothetical protein